MQHYLGTLPIEERIKLEPFLFPAFLNTPRLTKLRMHTVHKGRATRKEQAFAVVRDLRSLVTMGRRRYKWLADLNAQVLQIAESVRNEQITLPAIIKCCGLNNQELTFRVWDRKSWLSAHQEKYHPRSLYYKTGFDKTLFLQLVGILPDSPWFLRQPR